MTDTKELLSEFREKLNDVKQELLRIVERANTTNYTKDKLKDELFKLYLEVK